MKYYEEESETYDVRLMCRNCNNEWIQKVEKGIYIRYEKDNNYMIKTGDSKKHKSLFKCPKCSARNKIARLPLN